MTAMFNSKARSLYALASICLLLALSPCATAMERAFGYSRILATGAPAPFATITVRNAGTATVSTVFSDNISTPKANPFSADISGYWFFYAANGRYDITLSGGGIVSPYTLSDVVVLDSTAVGSICGVSGAGIVLATGTSGTDFNLNCNDGTDTITYNIPSASIANRGVVTTGAQTFAGAKSFSTPINTASGGTGVNGSAAANGLLLIGNGTGFTGGTLTPGVLGVTVTNGAGSITLDTIQDIRPSATPTFSTLTLTDNPFMSISSITDSGTMTTDQNGTAQVVAQANGQLLIGNTTGLPIAAALGSGPGIAITSGAGAITITNAAILNGFNFGTVPSQTFAVGTGGSDFNISSSGGVHTFSIPDASTINRGVVSTGTQSFLGRKTFANALNTDSVYAAADNSGANAASTTLGLLPGRGTGNAATTPVSIYKYHVGASSSTPQVGGYSTDPAEAWQGGTAADPVTDTATFYGTHGEQWVRGYVTELLTLSNAGATTDTTNQLLPAGAIIESVVARVTTTISGGGVANFSIGDDSGSAGTAARFSALTVGLASGSTRIGITHMNGNVSTTALGPTQAAAAKVRITCDATPTAGVIRISVFYRRFVAPTS